LLYGPLGTGMTMLAKAIVRESGVVFINVRISNLMSKWLGLAIMKAVITVFCNYIFMLKPSLITLFSASESMQVLLVLC